MQKIKVTHIPVEFIMSYHGSLLQHLGNLRVSSGKPEDMQAAALELTYQQGKRDSLVLLMQDYENFVISNADGDGAATNTEPPAGSIVPAPTVPVRGLAAAQALSDQVDTEDLLAELNAVSTETQPIHPDLQG